MEIKANELMQIIGELYLENRKLREKIIYLEDMISQLPKRGVADQVKEDNPDLPGD